MGRHSSWKSNFFQVQNFQYCALVGTDLSPKRGEVGRVLPGNIKYSTSVYALEVHF